MIIIYVYWIYISKLTTRFDLCEANSIESLQFGNIAENTTVLIIESGILTTNRGSVNLSFSFPNLGKPNKSTEFHNRQRGL